MHEQWETGKTLTNVLLHVVYPVKIESSTVQTWRRKRFRSEKELGKQQRYGTIVEEEVFENILSNVKRRIPETSLKSQNSTL
jgi:Trm5-related predicted tRNA methylase